MKLYRNFMMAGVFALGLAACGDDLTITDPGTPPPSETPNIISFSVNPTTVTMAPGAFTQAAANLVTKTGVTGSVSWASSNAAVATVDAATGLITAVSEGATVVTATATAGGQTATAAIGVTIRPIDPAQVSIQSVTTGANDVPVTLTNVQGQIEINMNFDPGEQDVEQITVYIGNVEAASQTFASAPAAGEISLSVNTANFVKNPATGLADVDFENGPTTISAAVEIRNSGEQTATNTIQIVLNNEDGWAADLTKPTRSANSAGGVTYWGGPGAEGVTTATLYPVLYTPGREVTEVTFRVGHAGGFGCTPGITMTELPFRATFGYGDVADVDCEGYEWQGGGFGGRDNIVFMGALDNQSTPFPAFMPLIANTTVLGATPDSARFDWDAPVVNTPSIARTAPAVTGWVNASYSFINFSSDDDGVGLRATRDRSVSYDAPNCDAGDAEGVAMPTGTGADIPECATNFIGGTVGLGGTAPYQVAGTESDRLGNVGMSSSTSTFGVDKTNPDIRWGDQDVAPDPAYAGEVVADPDSLFITKPVPGTDVWRAEYLDDRAGFYNAGAPSGSVAAQRHTLSTAGHVANTGACIIGTGTPGAAFVTAQACGMVAISTVGTLRLDGWQGGESVDVPEDEGYYGYRTRVTDAAGNASTEIARRALVNAEDPFATGLGLPAQLTGAAMAFNVTAADSVEVVNVALALAYPGLPSADTLRYPQSSVGVVWNDEITSPLNASVSPIGAPFVRHLEVVDGTAFPGNNVSAVALNKPTAVQVRSFNPANYSAESSVIAIPALNVEDGETISDWNTANPTIRVEHWRVIPSLATTDWFGSTTPLRAQAVAPTNSPNPPFARVDFFRLDVSGDFYNYLGSTAAAAAIGSDQGTYRSWVYPLAAGSFADTWEGEDQGAATSGDVVIAVGVTAGGDAIAAEFLFP